MNYLLGWLRIWPKMDVQDSQCCKSIRFIACRQKRNDFKIWTERNYRKSSLIGRKLLFFFSLSLSFHFVLIGKHQICVDNVTNNINKKKRNQLIINSFHSTQLFFFFPFSNCEFHGKYRWAFEHWLSFHFQVLFFASWIGLNNFKPMIYQDWARPCPPNC